MKIFKLVRRNFSSPNAQIRVTFQMKFCLVFRRQILFLWGTGQSQKLMRDHDGPCQKRLKSDVVNVFRIKVSGN